MLLVYGPILIVFGITIIGLYPQVQEAWLNIERYLVKNGYASYAPDAAKIEDGTFNEISRRMNKSDLKFDKSMSSLARAHSKDMLQNNYLGKKLLNGVNNLDWLNCTYSTSMNSD